MTSRLREALEERLGRAPGGGRRRVVVHEFVDSTSSDLIQRTRDGAPVGTVVAAERQTAGRGRVGRRWVSSEIGDLAVSVSVAPNRMDEVPLVALAAGVSACDAIRAVGLPDAVLKWPNDVLFTGRKLGGILCEAASLSPRAIVVVGLGVNMAHRDFGEALRDKATSLEECGASPKRREDIAAHFVENLEAWVSRLADAGRGELVDAWRERAEPFGRLVQVGDLVGRTVGLDRDGRLEIRKKDGQIEKISGGIVETVE